MSDFVVNISGIKTLSERELPLKLKGALHCGDYEAEISLVGRVINKEGAFTFTGAIKGTLSGFCARCLTTVCLPYEAEVTFCFSNPESVTAEEETLIFEGSTADLSQVISGIIRADAPISIICSEGCKGLCEICGKDLNQDSCDCRREIINPVLDINIFKDNALEGR